jgi:DNA polymerase-3 subunit alpha (Gram-positive type)
MKEKGIPEWYYWSCDRIAYMFPKAHAVAYVLMAVRIAWFKIYKPLLFYSAFFSVRIDQFEPEIMLSGIPEILKRITEIESLSKTTAKEDDLLTMYQVALEMLRRGYKFLPVDITKSHSTDFLMEGDALRLPFISIPGLGLSVAKDIVEKRDEKPFSSLKDVTDRTRINKTVFEKMKLLGSFKDLKDEEDDGEVGLFGVSWQD